MALDPLLITPDEKTFLDELAADARQSISDGVAVDTDGDDAGDDDYGVTPVEGFDTLFIPDSEKDVKKIQNGLKSGPAAMVRKMRPCGYHIESLSPSFAFSAATDLLSATVAAEDRQKVDRLMMATVAFSCYSTATATRIDFWVDIDGVETTRQKFYFNDATSHRSMGGNWLIPVPAGTTTIKLRAIRGSGAGTIALDSNDSVALTLWG